MSPRPAHRPPLYTTPAVKISCSIPQLLHELLQGDGNVSATLTRIIAAHYNIDPYVNAR